ncbi:hypothetical protein ACHAWF_014067, partial [Thalassiosira exigua]
PIWKNEACSHANVTTDHRATDDANDFVRTDDNDDDDGRDGSGTGRRRRRRRLLPAEDVLGGGDGDGGDGPDDPGDGFDGAGRDDDGGGDDGDDDGGGDDASDARRDLDPDLEPGDAFRDAFAPVQSRRYRREAAVRCWSLCPSMDLVAIGTRTSSAAAAAPPSDPPSSSAGGGGGGEGAVGEGGGELSEEPASTGRPGAGGAGAAAAVAAADAGLSSRSAPDDDGGDDDDDGGERTGVDDVHNDAGKLLGATRLCWSPGGRCLAVGLADGGVSVHTVEPSSSGAAGGAGGTGEQGDAELRRRVRAIRPPRPSPRPVASSGGGVGDESDGDRDRSRGRSRSPNRSRTHEQPPKSGKGAGPLFSPRVTRSMAAARGGRRVEDQDDVPPREPPRDAARATEEAADEPPEAVVAPFPEPPSPIPRGPPCVAGMTWARHRTAPRGGSGGRGDDCRCDDRDAAAREAWRRASSLVGRGATFLPPGEAGGCDGGAGGVGGVGGGVGGTGARGDPFSLRAPPNVLCVASRDEVRWHFQGQYRVGSAFHDLDSGGDGGGGGLELACAPDLGALLVVPSASTGAAAGGREGGGEGTSATQRARLFLTPLLPARRHDLRALASHHRDLRSRVRDAREGADAALAAWRAALRPLDAKFGGLVALLRKYDVEPPERVARGAGGDADAVRTELLRFLLAGRSSAGKSSSSSNSSGAIDQFFTRATMHDQLLLREARGVEAGAAAAEGTLRGRALAAFRALAYCTGELYGSAAAAGAGTEEGEGGVDGRLVDPAIALRLHAAARRAYLDCDAAVARVALARSRIRDLLVWIRGTAAQVRARGTAPDGVQRRNARARRASDGTVRRVASFLAGDEDEDMGGWGAEGPGGWGGGGENQDRGLTECIIGAPISDFFIGDGQSEPGESDLSLPAHLSSIRQLSSWLFDGPRRVFDRSLDALDICFEAPHCVVAIHTRIGAGSAGVRGSGIKEGCFVPFVEGDSIGARCYWMLLARSLGSVVELILIPGRGADFDSDADGGYYLRAHLKLPEGCEAANVAFYGDDGISSLSPGSNDDSEAKEGTQSLGLLVNCGVPASREIREELWLLPYDDVAFQKFDLGRSSKNEVVITAAKFADDECTYVALQEEEMSDACRTIVPKRRHISTRLRTTSEMHMPSQLNLCGSRGTGGVITYGESTSLNLFDLEEDEENGSSSEEDDFLVMIGLKLLQQVQVFESLAPKVSY